MLYGVLARSTFVTCLVLCHAASAGSGTHCQSCGNEEASVEDASFVQLSTVFRAVSALSGREDPAPAPAPAGDGAVPAPFSAPAPVQNSSLVNEDNFLVNRSQILDNVINNTLVVNHTKYSSPLEIMKEALAPAPAPYTVLPEQAEVIPTMKPLPNLTAEEAQKINQSHINATYDCTLLEWSDWSDCWHQNSNGLKGTIQMRTRNVETPGDIDKGGIRCPDGYAAAETRECAKEFDLGGSGGGLSKFAT